MQKSGAKGTGNSGAACTRVSALASLTIIFQSLARQNLGKHREEPCLNRALPTTLPRSVVGGDRVPDLSGATRDQLAAVTEIVVDEYTDGRGEDARDVKRVRVKLADKRAALADLGRHLGMFVDRHEHSGPAGGPIETAALSPEERRAAAKRMLDEAFGPREGQGEDVA